MHAKTLDQVEFDLGGGCRSEAQDGHHLELLAQHAEREVILAEVLTPVRYAMDLVDHEARNLALTIHHFDHFLVRAAADELLRSHIHYFVFSVDYFVLEPGCRR